MIDTGSTGSFISASTAAKYGLNVRAKRKVTAFANGDSLITSGTAKAKMEVNRKTNQVLFTVAKHLVAEVILGLDVLRSGATCHMAMSQCCFLAKGAKRPSHPKNTIKIDRIPFDPCNSIKRFDLCPFDQKNLTYLQPPPDPSCLFGQKQEQTFKRTVFLQ